MAPRARFVPLECSDGASPTKAIVLGALGKRRGSPSSAAIAGAVRSSRPRKHRRRVTGDWSGSSVNSSRSSVSTVRNRAMASSTVLRSARCVWVRAGSGRVCARSQASWRFDQAFFVPVKRRPFRNKT